MMHRVAKGGVSHGRRQFEKGVVAEMIALYCRRHHRGKPVCAECTELAAYAAQRLDACRFGDAKPFCSACTVHCYRPDRREQVRRVMRYAGPRMLLYHPVMTVRHVLLSQKAHAG